MKKNQQIEFTIARDGSVTIDAQGFTDGSSCRVATEDYEKALGTIESRRTKPHAERVKQAVKVGS